MTQTPPRHLVLYADDDRDDIKFVEDAFNENILNIELVAVEDGQKAIEYLENLSVIEPNPCLIILDINMPRLNGKEALIQIRQMERFKNTPIVLFSTSSLPQDKQFALKHAAGFITKPLDSRQMQIITDQFIEHCDDEIRRNIQKRFN
ncbi:MAG: response regulator [Chitinophagaceae bacterium]|nr:response regulator [Chitinophagaceae bacterium]